MIWRDFHILRYAGFESRAVVQEFFMAWSAKAHCIASVYFKALAMQGNFHEHYKGRQTKRKGGFWISFRSIAV
jgi:hypothetical protein